MSTPQVAGAPLALGVLVSGRGSNLGAVLSAIADGQLAAEVRVVVSNRPGAPALELAARAGVPSRVVDHRDYPSRPAFEEALTQVLREHVVSWVVLAGFMRLLTRTFLDAFPGRVINIHPSLLPAFPGIEAQRQALEHGVKLAGCTVHFVDAGTDSGPIVAQAAVPVLEGDDVERLSARILAEEHRLLPRALQLIAEGRVQLEGRRVRILNAAPSQSGALRHPA